MRIDNCIGCTAFPCEGVLHESYAIPGIDLKPEKICLLMISEAAAAYPGDDYYAGGGSLFERTTVQAFNDAGVGVSSVLDILRLGVYLTPAVKCGKMGHGIESGTIRECSHILERELALFPNVRALLLMGDVAIRALNFVAQRAGERRVIPAMPTYTLRGQRFFFLGRRVLPSYLQAGPSFYLEKSKRRMIAEDIAAALELVHSPALASVG